MSNLTLKKQVWDSLAITLQFLIITLQFVIISLQIPYYYLKIPYYYLTIRYYYLTNTLQIPPSSASSEQLFSSTGDIISEEKQVEYRESRDATVLKEEPT